MGAKFLSTILLLSTTIAIAQDHPIPPANPDCAAQAIDKKIDAGSLPGFMKKCENDMAQRNCQTSADDKKITAKARSNFVKNCVKDAAQFQ